MRSARTYRPPILRRLIASASLLLKFKSFFGRVVGGEGLGKVVEIEEGGLVFTVGRTVVVGRVGAAPQTFEPGMHRPEGLLS